MCQHNEIVVSPLRTALRAMSLVTGQVTDSLLEKLPVKNTKPKSRKLWEMEIRYHCPIIGTCLSVSELRKIGRQAKLVVNGRTDYELHNWFVAEAEQANHLTRKVQKYLDKKYSRHIKQFSHAKNEAQLLSLWDEACQHGEVSGAFWALMTHPLINENVQHTAYSQIHMLSHQVGSLQRADLRKLHQLEQKNAELQAQLTQTRQRLLKRDQKIQTLQQKLEQTQQKNVLPTTMLVDVEKTETLQQQLRHYEKDIGYLQLNSEKLKKQAMTQNQHLAELQQQLVQEQKDKKTIEKQLEQVLASNCTNYPPEDDKTRTWCTQQHLQGHCILYVGGRDKLKSHFRHLVESYGGSFLHHDGGLHGKDHELHQVLSKADTVFCPLDCISHNACQTVKKFCKKYDKSVVLLRTESLSAFSRGLQDTFINEPNFST